MILLQDKDRIRFKRPRLKLDNILLSIALAIILFPMINKLHMEQVTLDLKSLDGSNIILSHKPLIQLEKKYQNLLKL